MHLIYYVYLVVVICGFAKLYTALKMQQCGNPQQRRFDSCSTVTPERKPA